MAETIDIDFGGESIKVPKWATEDTLRLLVQALDKPTKGIGKALKDASTELGTSTGTKFTGSISKAGKATDKLSVKTTVAEKALGGLKSTLVGGAGLIGQLSTSTGKFSDLNAVTDIIIDSFVALTAAIPFAGSAIEAFGEVGKQIIALNNAILDDTLESFDQLAGAGFGLQNDLFELSKSAAAGNLSLEQLTTSIMSAQQGVLVLGNSFDTSVSRFASIQQMLRDEDGDFAKALKSFGIGAEDTAEFLAGFIQDQRTNLALRNMSEEELARRTFQYARNLRVISEFTGQEADQLRAAQQNIAADGAFQSKLQQMRLAGQNAEARAIEESIAALPTEQAKQAAKELFTFGSAVTQQSALFMQIAPEFNKSVQGLFDDVLAQGEFSIQDTPSYASVVRAIADIATNADNLQVGTLGLVEAGMNPLTQLINETLVQAGNLNAIIGEEGIEGAVKRLTEIVNDQNDQIDGINIPEFNKRLNDLRTELESLGPDIKMAILQNIQPLTELQISLAEKLTDTILKVSGALSGFTGDDTTNGDGKSFGEAFLDANPEKEGVQLTNFGFEEELGAFFKKYVLGPNFQDVVDTSTTAPGKAAGGPVGKGLYLVGERGPELLKMNPGSSGYVYNNSQLTAMATPRYNGGPVGDSLGDMGQSAEQTNATPTNTNVQTAMATANNNMDTALKDVNMSISESNSELKSMNRMLTKMLSKITTQEGYF